MLRKNSRPKFGQTKVAEFGVFREKFAENVWNVILNTNS